MKCKGKSAKKISELVKKHLVEMKKHDELMNYEKNDKKHRSCDVKYRDNFYKHIFDVKMAKKYTENGNVRDIVPYVYLAPYRNEIISSVVKNNIPLHIYYRNFNSSQGLVLNFLGPIVNTDYEESFSEKVFGIENGKIKIEHKMEDFGSHSHSSSEIDFTISNGETLHLFEAKYTEQGFGRASISKKNKQLDIEKYQDKWFGTNEYQKINNGRTCVKYNQLVCDEIMKDIPFNNEKSSQKETFIKNYQLIRNLYNTVYCLKEEQIKKRNSIGKMHIVVLEDNLTHCREFNRFADLVIDKSIVNNDSYLTWQSLCEKAIQFACDKDDDLLKSHYQLFKKVFLDYNE